MHKVCSELPSKIITMKLSKLGTIEFLNVGNSNLNTLKIFMTGLQIRVFWSDPSFKTRSDLDPIFKIRSDPDLVFKIKPNSERDTGFII